MTAMATIPKFSYAEELAQIAAKFSAAPELSALLHTAAFHTRQLLGCSVVIFTKTGQRTSVCGGVERRRAPRRVTARAV